MKKISRLFLFAFIGIGLFSCGNEDLVEDSNPSPNVKKLEFIYDGVTYSSSYTLNEESIMVIDDKNVSELYERLCNLPELSIYVNEDGVEEYFENSEMALQSLNVEDSSQPQSKSTIIIFPITGSIALYGKADFQNILASRNFTLPENGLEIGIHFPQDDWSIPPAARNPLNFNDKTVSAEVYAKGSFADCIITFYEGFDYKGKSRPFKFRFSDPLPFKVNNLADYKMVDGGLFNHSKWWDTEVSSVRVNFTRVL